MNIHIEKRSQNSKRKNFAKLVWENNKLNDKYDIDYFSNENYVIIKKKEDVK